MGGGGLGKGSDIDAAVLAATNFGGGGLAQKLEISFKCEDLPNMDAMSYSDPFVVFYKQTGRMWQKIGQTEVIHDTLNPQFVKKVMVDFHFEQSEVFKVEVYDSDDDSQQTQDLSKHDFIGMLQFQLHEVVTARDQIMTKTLINENRAVGKSGRIVISAEEVTATANSEIVMFNPVATLPDQGLCFFIIYRNQAPGQFSPIYKSEIKRPDQGSFRWNQVQVGTTDLCKDEIERQIKIEFFKSNSSGKHKILDSVESMTLAQLREGTAEYQMLKKRGALQLQGLKVERQHSFLEYIFGGCEVELSFAIDFTLSNGDPRTPSSLHFFDPQRNQYLQAIHNVGNILQFYNSDKQINLYGFGGAIPPYSNRASHCFALNGDIFNPRVNGIEGVIQCYQNALNRCALYGPTHFADILREVNNHVQSHQVTQMNQKFHILVIITDGVINDMNKTIDEIVRGSELPLAIIIVGVGEADFSSMETLDGDDEALYSQAYRKYMAADIVQFVPYNDFKNNPHLLAKETLMEVPSQLLNWMRKHNISPHPRTEEQRRLIQQQLSMRPNQQAQLIPRYFLDKKERFLQQCAQMGFDLY